MNTKRDFTRAAELIKQFKSYRIEGATPKDTELVTKIFCLYFKMDNPDFDEKRFRVSCILK